MSKHGTLHHTMCLRAARWIKGTMGCRIVVAEFSPVWGESPDAWGMKRVGNQIRSYLVEVKTSISDFKADSGKTFRRMPESGIGKYRYYMVPEGLLDSQDLPDGWGLIWYRGESRTLVIRRQASETFNTYLTASNEMSLVYSLLNRAVAKELFSALTEPYKKLIEAASKEEK